MQISAHNPVYQMYLPCSDAQSGAVSQFMLVINKGLYVAYSSHLRP